MRKAHAIAVAGMTSALLAGAAFAATPNNHVMMVPLPDGSTARIEYVGDIAPEVRIDPANRSFTALSAGIPMLRHFEEMQRQIDAMMRQIPAARVTARDKAQPYIATYGDMPPASTSVSVVSSSIGGRTCTRTTKVTSQGTGKAPKVVSRLSGDCSAADASAAALPGSGPVSHT